MKVKVILAIFCVSLTGVAGGACRSNDATVPPAPAQIATSLLDTDRAMAQLSQRSGWAAALDTMLADNVVMPAPPDGFTRGKAAAMQALQRTIPGATKGVRWTPVRVGISADGHHGFTLGYMTHQPDSGDITYAKYMAYWVRSTAGWRVAAYKRSRATTAPTDTTMMAAALPSQQSADGVWRTDTLQLQTELMANERAFSDEAQRVGLGNAFAAFGSADAVNMGGPGSAHFVQGAQAIAILVSGGDMTTSPVTWTASSALVALSGDLGITFGTIVVKEGAPPNSPGIPFFTIWHRNKPGDPWRYIAE